MIEKWRSLWKTQGDLIVPTEHILDPSVKIGAVRNEYMDWFERMHAVGDSMASKLEAIEKYCRFLKKKKNTALPVIAVTDRILNLLVEETPFVTGLSKEEYIEELNRQAGTFDALAKIIESEDTSVTTNFVNLLLCRGLADICRFLAERKELE